MKAKTITRSYQLKVCDYANAFCYDDLSDIVTAITV